MDNIWGIDLGGTKIEVIVISGENNDIIARERINTEASEGYEHILSQIKKLIDTTAQKVGSFPKAVGFSTPGTLDPGTQTMKNCNTTAMNGMPMKRDLEKLLNIRIEMANDANCFALAEALAGAGKDLDAKVIFGVILGTGVGGGVVVNGQVLGGKHGIGGEWGHNQFYADGEDCYCGQKGCNEKVFAGPALERYYQRLSGNRLTLKEIYALHQSGNDTNATQTIRYLCQCFGQAISHIINVLDPDVVIIGGGVGNISEVYTWGVESLQNHIFNNRKVDTLFLKPKLGDSAGVFGAAELVR